MKTLILNFLATRIGAIIAPLIAAGLASAVTWLVTKLPWTAGVLTADNIAAFGSFVLASIMAWVNWMTTARGFKYGQQVQTALNSIGRPLGLTIPVDGVVGPDTAEHARTISEMTTPGGPFNPNAEVRRPEGAIRPNSILERR